MTGGGDGNGKPPPPDETPPGDDPHGSCKQSIRQLRERLAAAKQKADSLQDELDKLRDYIENQPSTIEHEVLQVPVPTRRQKALEEALGYFAEAYPTSSAIETIEEFARQIESGFGPGKPAPEATKTD